jgi:putative Mg2+ transporter-C (MgtC) family protein
MMQEVIQQIKDTFIIEDSLIMLFKLLLSMILGFIVGAEREYFKKDAGFKTHVLVSMGSALFVIIALSITEQFQSITIFDPLRVASHIIVGVGFIGGGTIFLKDRSVNGLSTAANLWIASGIGMSVGYGLYGLAIFVTILTLLMFLSINTFYSIKKWIQKKLNK